MYSTLTLASCVVACCCSSSYWSDNALDAACAASLCSCLRAPPLSLQLFFTSNISNTAAVTPINSFQSNVYKLRYSCSSSYCPDYVRQPAATKTASKPGTGPSSLSSTDSRGVPDTSPDQSDDTDAAGLEQDEVAAARAQLKARAGAKGRRGGKASQVGSGQGQVRADWPD